MTEERDNFKIILWDKSPSVLKTIIGEEQYLQYLVHQIKLTMLEMNMMMMMMMTIIIIIIIIMKNGPGFSP